MYIVGEICTFPFYPSHHQYKQIKQYITVRIYVIYYSPNNLGLRVKLQAEIGSPMH